MKTNKQNIHRVTVARGFSLVELMVALLIGIVISIGVVQIFGATRATYQLDEALARAQENGRFALEFLTQDIRHAGYLGCRRNQQPQSATYPYNYLVTPVPIIVGSINAFEYAGTGISGAYSTPPTPSNSLTGWDPIVGRPALTAADLGLAGGALPGSDIIVLQRMVPAWRLVPPFTTPAALFINPALTAGILNGTILMAADCKDAAIFMVTAVNQVTGAINHAAGAATNRCGNWVSGIAAGGARCNASFEPPAGPGIELGTLQTIAFFVAVGADAQPTLYRSVAGNAQPLVEGVENFQVLYGLDTVIPADGIADLYVPASGVADMGTFNIVSVQIGLLVYGVNATGTANDTELDTPQIVAGTTISPPTTGNNARKKRRVFSTTIQLRNRGT